MHNPSEEHEYIFCNRCRGETRHELVGEDSRSFPECRDKDGAINAPPEDHTYSLLVCCGCGVGTMRSFVRSPAYDRDFVEYFPPREQWHRQPRYFYQLPTPLQEIYQEIIAAINANLPVLCAGGLRALIEGICSDKEILDGNLEQRINRLKASLPENIVAHLHSFRFMGNVAMHKLDPPSFRELQMAIEVSEDVLNFLYDLDYKASAFTSLRRSRFPA